MGNVLRFEKVIEVTSVECCSCGHMIFMSTDFETRRRRDHKLWYCTSCGTNQHWTGKSDVEKLREELAAEQQRKNHALCEANRLREERDKAIRSKERIKKRVANGVCPCCTRSFTNLRRHIAAKHPGFKAEHQP